MRLNNVGQIVQDEWFRTSIVRPDVELDAFVVMPNHVHGIIVILDDAPPVGATPCGCPLTPRGCPSSGQAPGPFG